jgi:hypothetical protein
MTSNQKLLVLAAAAVIALRCGAAFADTVVVETPDGDISTTTTTTSTVTTHTTTDEVPGAVPLEARRIDFMEFDENGDALLTRAEIGNRLFKLYDTDGNQVIDNIEYERRAVLTVTPMETTTSVHYDFDGDGVVDESQFDHHAFLEASQLARFDKNLDGLSPHEFLGRDFMEADVDKSKMVEMKEWQGAYDAQLDAKNKRKAEVNH